MQTGYAPGGASNLRRRLGTAAFVLLLANSALAVEFSTSEVAGKRVTLCKVDIRKDRLQLFLRDDSGAPFKQFDRIGSWLAARDQKLVFAMNAGMYHSDFRPVGLFIAGGQKFAPLNTATGTGNFFLKPNGVFVVTATKAMVVDTAEFPKLTEPVLLATQSGPMLVKNGSIHPRFDPKSESRLYRNGVGVPSPEKVVFAISEEPVNFFEFASLFRDQLKCMNALFFDGTVSSLYAPELKRDDFHMDLGPMIGVVENRKTLE